MTFTHYWLTIERLGLRRFTAADFNWFADLYSDAEVMRYVGGVKDRSRTEDAFQQRVLGYYDEHPGLGVWMTVERATGVPMGFHLLNHIRGEQTVQVGFVLRKEACGKGYATEMAISVLRDGFDLAHADWRRDRLRNEICASLWNRSLLNVRRRAGDWIVTDFNA